MPAPFDGRFKILAEEYPDLLLRLLGILEPGVKPEFVDILRELHLDPVQVDHVYRIGDEVTGRLVHFEAITSWSAQRTSRLALYRFLLGQKYEIPTSSYVILMAEKYAPKNLPERVVYEEPDGFRIEAPYKVVRLWEIDPSLAFEPGFEPLLPWVPLLKTGEAELLKGIERIQWLAGHPDSAPYPVPVMVSNLAVLAGLRYDEDVISGLLERLRTNMMLDTELFVDTWLYKKGEAAGEAKGEAKGKAEGKRGALRMVITKRFPSLDLTSQIDQISTETLDELLAALICAQSPEEACAAVQAALRVN